MNKVREPVKAQEEEMSTTASVAFAFGFAVACIVFLSDWLNSGRAFGWDMVLLGAVVGAMVTAVLYAIGRLAMSPEFVQFLAIMLSKPPSRAAKNEEEKPRQNNFTAPTPQGMKVVPDWEKGMDKRLDVAGYFGVGADGGNGRSVLLPDGFDVEFLYMVAEARWGKKLDLVSQRALSDIGISRDSGDAGNVLAFLQSAGLVETNGINYRHKWTEAGELVFPVGKRTALPHRIGVVRQNRGGVQSTAAAAATAAAVAATVYGGGGEG